MPRVRPGSAECMCEWPAECHGSGIIHCDGCGGDICACLCGGDMQCPGCQSCDGELDVEFEPEMTE